MDSAQAKGLITGRLADYMFDYSCLCESGWAQGQHSAAPAGRTGEIPAIRSRVASRGRAAGVSGQLRQARLAPHHYPAQRQTQKHRVRPVCHWPCPLHRLLAYFSLSFFHLNGVLGVGGPIPARLTA